MRTTKRAASSLFSLVFTMLLSQGLVAQTVNGSFRGTVTDQSGAAIPGATVTLTSAATGVSRQTTTGASGDYEFPNVPPTVYNFTVSYTGFETLENPGVTLAVNQAATLDFVLTTGVVRQTVTVAAQAQLANTVDATVGTVIEQQEVVQLPLNGRQFTQLILLSPGAAPQSSGQQDYFEVHADFGAVSPAVNGSRSEMNDFTIDGVENNELFFNFPGINPPPDAIQEFDVQTDMTSGQYGRAAGANVNVVTRSGGNEFHGDLWEFIRNTSLDARNYFNPSVSTFHQNQFGGTLGGPIRKNKVWAFGWYEGLRKGLGSSLLSHIPTAAQLQGNLAGFPQIYNPFTTSLVGTDAQGNPIFSRDPFPNNQISPSLLNPAAQQLAGFGYPTPNYSGTGGINYINDQPVRTIGNQFGIRIDAALSPKTTLFGRFTRDLATKNLVQPLPAFTASLVQLGLQQVVGVTHTFGPTKVLDLHAQYLRTYVAGYGPFPTIAFLQKTNLLTDFPEASGVPPSYPGLTIAGVTGMAGTTQDWVASPTNQWQYTGKFIDIVGHHTLTFGANYFHSYNGNYGGYASASFDNLPTSDPQNPSTTGAGLASFLLGLPTSASQLRGDSETDYKNSYYSGYVDDEWKATPKLTVTLDVRYEYMTPFHERLDRASTLDVNDSTATNTVWLIAAGAKPEYTLPASSPTLDIEHVAHMWYPDRRDWAPRVGLAYRLPRNTVVRGGYGMFYDFNQSGLQDGEDTAAGWPFGIPNFTPPNLNQPSVANPLPSNTLGGQVFPPFEAVAGLPTTAPGFAVNRAFRRPYVQDWNFGLEKSLAPSWLLSATYIGSKGTRLVDTPTVNIAPSPGPGNAQLRARLPLFAPFEVDSYGDSSFEGVELKVQKRFSRGLSLLAAYTFSKSIDDQSAAHGSTQPGESIQNGLNIRGDRALSDFDVPQNFVLSYVYNLPFGKGQRFMGGAGKLASYLITGWQIDGILTLHSGFPFNITIPFDNANTGSTSQRPSINAPLLPPGFQQNVQHWFNTAALYLAPFGTAYGNLGRNVIRQDGVKNLDFGVTKPWRLTEKTSLEFRSEFFNLTNHPDFGSPDSGFGDSTFGQVSSAGNPRFIQFGLKFLF